MFLKLIIAIFGWISYLIKDYFTPIQTSTDDLHEIARQEIDEKLGKILHIQLECDVSDAKMRFFSKPVAQIESEHRGFQFFIDNIIHHDPIVFEGKIFDKKVAVKEIYGTPDSVQSR